VVGEFVAYYNEERLNEERLHSAIGYVAPMGRLEGREDQIVKEREQKLERARQKWALHHRAQQVTRQAA
jgi:hypothetical protein